MAVFPIGQRATGTFSGAMRKYVRLGLHRADGLNVGVADQGEEVHQNKSGKRSCGSCGFKWWMGCAPPELLSDLLPINPFDYGAATSNVKLDINTPPLHCLASAIKIILPHERECLP